MNKKRLWEWRLSWRFLSFSFRKLATKEECRIYTTKIKEPESSGSLTSKNELC